MRSAQEWFDLYGESHRNPVNKAIHWVCIPVIVLSTLGMLQAIPHPFGGLPLDWGVLAAAASLAFYVSLSWTVALGMAAFGGACLALNGAITAAGLPLLWVSVGLFAVAWVAQFIGHAIEGKKPSFFQDLQFLLVGPAWLLQALYRRIGVPVAPRRD